MTTLNIQFTKPDADATVDSLEVAINIVTNELEGELKLGDSNYSAAQLHTAIESMKMLRLGFLLVSRNAAKEAAPKSDSQYIDPATAPLNTLINEFRKHC